MGLFPFGAKRAASHSLDKALIDLITVHDGFTGAQPRACAQALPAHAQGR